MKLSNADMDKVKDRNSLLFMLCHDCVNSSAECLIEYTSIEINKPTMIGKVVWLNKTTVALNLLHKFNNEVSIEKHDSFKEELFCKVQPYMKSITESIDFDWTIENCSPRNIEGLLIKLFKDAYSSCPTEIKDTINTDINEIQQKENYSGKYSDNDIIILSYRVVAWLKLYDSILLRTSPAGSSWGLDNTREILINDSTKLLNDLIKFVQLGDIADTDYITLFQDNLLMHLRAANTPGFDGQIVTRELCHPLSILIRILNKTSRILERISSGIMFGNLRMSMKYENIPDVNNIAFLDFTLDKCTDLVTQLIDDYTDISQRYTSVLYEIVVMRKLLANYNNKQELFTEYHDIITRLFDSVKKGYFSTMTEHIASLYKHLISYSQSHEMEDLGIKESC